MSLFLVLCRESVPIRRCPVSSRVAPVIRTPTTLLRCSDSFFVMTHSCVSWRIQMCHDSFTCAVTYSYVPRLVHMCMSVLPHSKCTMTYSYVTWPIHMCDILHPYVNDSFVCVTLIHVCDMIYSYVPWLIQDMPQLIYGCDMIHPCDMTHPYVWHDSIICDMTHPYMPWLIRLRICIMPYPYVPWFIHMCHDSSIYDMTRSYVTWIIQMCHDSSICDKIHPCV